MERNSAFSSEALIALLAALSLSGCSVSPELAKSFNEKLGPILGIKLQSNAPTPPKEAPKPAEDDSDNRAVNADFIREMFRVVLLRDVRSREEFDRYMNNLDQGGHYEAIYNGIVYAAEYREKEKGVSPVPALNAYKEIMAQLKLDQKYDSLKIAQAEVENAGAPAGDSGNAAPPQPTEAERMAIMNDLERDAITKSAYTLKRLLGEEVLKTIDVKKAYREKLATWFARFTVMLAKRGVDFGLPQRNKTEEYFHYKWALEADEDRLKWECLNRVHRIINAGAGMREPVAAAMPPSAPAAAPAAAAPPAAPQAASAAPAAAQ